jgi:hypothetical protein
MRVSSHVRKKKSIPPSPNRIQLCLFKFFSTRINLACVAGGNPRWWRLPQVTAVSQHRWMDGAGDEPTTYLVPCVTGGGRERGEAQPDGQGRRGQTSPAYLDGGRGRRSRAGESGGKKYGARGAHRGTCAHPGASPLLGHPTPPWSACFPRLPALAMMCAPPSRDERASFSWAGPRRRQEKGRGRETKRFFFSHVNVGNLRASASPKTYS